MNILYIGPYRQIDYMGQVSNLHINSIRSNLKKEDILITRSIYMNHNLSDAGNSIASENICVDRIDCIIQYVPINFVAIEKGFKNFIIPIIDPKLTKISEDYKYNILNFCDTVLVDNDMTKNLFKKTNISTNIEMYSEKFIDIDMQKFNLDSIKSSYKFGFIGQCHSNLEIIQKIIQCFFIASRKKEDMQLYLFLRGSEQDKKTIDDNISKIKEQLKIPQYIKTINVIFGIWDLKESITALNSIDCFLSLNNDIRLTFYESFFSSRQENNKFLISRNNISYIDTPNTIVGHKYEYNNLISSISVKGMVDSMISASSSFQKDKYKEYPSLGKIICKPLQ